MQTKTRQSWAVFKAGEGQFVRCNCAKADKRNRQGVPMKQRDAEQGQRKQDEFEWNREDEDWLGQFYLGRFLTDPNFLWFRYNESTVALEANSRVVVSALDHKRTFSVRFVPESRRPLRPTRLFPWHSLCIMSREDDPKCSPFHVGTAILSLLSFRLV